MPDPLLSQTCITTLQSDLSSFRTKLKSLTAGHTTTLHVGHVSSEKFKTFYIHKDLLTYHSSFFTAAFSGSFLESHTQHIDLPAETPDIFSHFATWVYTPTLDPRLFFKNQKPAYFTLLHLYSLADRLCIPLLRNQIIDLISDLAEQTNSVPTPSDTFLLYNTLPATCKLRQLILDLFLFKKTEKLISEHPDEWHPDFLRELFVKAKTPSVAAMARHSLLPLTPVAWRLTRACEVCKTVLGPGVGALQCTACKRGFCQACVGKGTARAEWEAGREVCRPWLGGRCRLYHEHGEEGCGDVMMGR